MTGRELFIPAIFVYGWPGRWSKEEETEEWIRRSCWLWSGSSVSEIPWGVPAGDRLLAAGTQWLWLEDNLGTGARVWEFSTESDTSPQKWYWEERRGLNEEKPTSTEKHKEGGVGRAESSSNPTMCVGWKWRRWVSRRKGVVEESIKLHTRGTFSF